MRRQQNNLNEEIRRLNVQFQKLERENKILDSQKRNFMQVAAQLQLSRDKLETKIENIKEKISEASNNMLKVQTDHKVKERELKQTQ